MEIRITASIACAIKAVIALMRGDVRVVGDPAPIPEWRDIPFPGEIVASPIRRIRRHDPERGWEGYWELEREVEFIYRDKVMAHFLLEGMKIDGDKLDGERTGWCVTKIEYAPAEGDWIEIQPMRGFTAVA